jgi:hypothetical protein
MQALVPDSPAVDFIKETTHYLLPALLTIRLVADRLVMWR